MQIMLNINAIYEHPALWYNYVIYIYLCRVQSQFGYLIILYCKIEYKISVQSKTLRIQYNNTKCNTPRVCSPDENVFKRTWHGKASVVGQYIIVHTNINNYYYLRNGSSKTFVMSAPVVDRRVDIILQQHTRDFQKFHRTNDLV